jgi:hypothetical protein
VGLFPSDDSEQCPGEQRAELESSKENRRRGVAHTPANSGESIRGRTHARPRPRSPRGNLASDFPGHGQSHEPGAPRRVAASHAPGRKQSLGHGKGPNPEVYTSGNPGQRDHARDRPSNLPSTEPSNPPNHEGDRPPLKCGTELTPNTTTS